MKFTTLAPAIDMFEFPETLAKDLLHLFKIDERVIWKKSGVGISGVTEQDIRTSQEFPFEQEMPISAQKVKEVFVSCVDNYTERMNIPVTQDEGLNLLKYTKGGKYNYHSDGDWTLYRTVSGLIYLNPTEYEGGETHFKYFDLSVKPDYPAIVLFPSNYAYVHSAMPVISGEKYIFVTWMNDLPPGFSRNIMSNIAISVGYNNGHRH